MAEIRVTIKPAFENGPIRFFMQDVPNAKMLVETLSEGCGPGTLWDSDMVYVSPTSARQLVPGDYTFRVNPIFEGDDQRDPMLPACTRGPLCLASSTQLRCYAPMHCAMSARAAAIATSMSESSHSGDLVHVSGLPIEQAMQYCWPTKWYHAKQFLQLLAL